MITEHALLHIAPDRVEDFKKGIGEALAIIEKAEGAHGATVRQQHEDPTLFLLIVTWDSVDAHLAFRQTDAFGAWREKTVPFYSELPTVTHYLAPL
jgi:quinol monooxygenase YgiN